MLEYIISDVLREFLIFIGGIRWTLRSLQLFSLCDLCYMGDLKDAACVVKPINLPDSRPAAFVWTTALLVRRNELLPFTASMSSCGNGSWNSVLNFATVCCGWVFGFLIAHFRVGACGSPQCHESLQLAYKLGSPSKAVRYSCRLAGHCALYPDLRAISAVRCLMVPVTAKRSSSQHK